MFLVKKIHVKLSQTNPAEALDKKSIGFCRTWFCL